MKNSLLFGTLFAAAAVILGAFGAHSLKALLSAEHLQTFETGVRYQFYHAFALIAVFLVAQHLPATAQPRLRWAMWCFVVGIFCFSGSIYLLAVRTILPFDVTWVGPITPLGGLFFIIGWGLFLVSSRSIITHNRE
jgi:uncharacterized membrane protein YgdD (TMEM256/DUF423 family)